MAFLCPVRIRRNKKKKQEVVIEKTPELILTQPKVEIQSREVGACCVKAIDDESVRGPAPSMGRITGSASIETLVRVGIEKENGLSPESKMVVLHDFTPCVDDELEVKRGQVVHVLYQENDWVYVISEDNKEGFIPHSYCAQFGSQMAGLALNVKKKMPRDHSLVDQGGGRLRMNEHMESDHNTTTATTNTNMSGGKVNQGLEQSDSDSFQDSSLKLNVRSGGPSQSRSSSLLSESSSQPEIHPFYKDSHGRFIVLYSYHAQDENDLSVDRGQCVTVLNKDDPEWFWVLRADGQEGFVPAGFVYPLDAIQRQQTMTASPNVPMTTAPPLSSSGGSGPSSLSPGNQPTFGSTGGTIPQPQGLPTPPIQGLPIQSGTPQGIPSGPPSHSGDMRYSGTELVMLYDYKAQAPDDLSVRRGDWVYADLNNQTVDGWLWAYAPKTRKYGFIPKAYARPPAMTSL